MYHTLKIILIAIIKLLTMLCAIIEFIVIAILYFKIRKVPILLRSLTSVASGIVTADKAQTKDLSALSYKNDTEWIIDLYYPNIKSFIIRDKNIMTDSHGNKYKLLVSEKDSKDGIEKYVEYLN